MQNTIIRVMIVEDSRLYQIYLRKILERDGCLEVVGMAGTGEEASQMAEELKPDVITLDLNLPDVKEFELLEHLQHTKIPIIVVSSLPQACEKAIQLGARDFIAKISDTKRGSADQFALLLQLKVKMQARTFRRRIPRTHPVALKTEKTAGSRTVQTRRGQIIAIGASLGGTESTLEILRELPSDMPGIVIVQHMQVGYTKAYAMRLNKNCRLEVREARDGDRILPGTVLVAESGKHLQVRRTLDGYSVRCRSGEKINGFCPSVDMLFSSVADAGADGIGVILTGMGQDGVQGIRKMHEKGLYTIGQDEESCAIFGMPRAAQEAGLLDELLNPGQIARRLVDRCKRRETGEKHGR